MMNIKDVKPVSKTCIFFIQYVTLVTASNNELFFMPPWGILLLERAWVRACVTLFVPTVTFKPLKLES